MAMSNSQAQPYAKAVFEIAVRDSRIDEWSLFLRSAARISSDADLQTFLNNPRLSRQQLADFFLGVCVDLLRSEAKELDRVTVQWTAFIRLLVEYRRLNLTPSIAFAFEQLQRARENSVNVEVTSVYPFNEQSSRELMLVLKKRFGCDAKITYYTDKNLIGGVVIRVGDLVIESSIRDKLIRLKESLIAQ